MKLRVFNPYCVLIAVVAFFTVFSETSAFAQAETDPVISGDKDTFVAFAYSPKGRRDPFKPLIEKKEKIVKKANNRPVKIKGPMEKFELSQFRLMAIMVVKGSPRAMVKAPDGKSYTVNVDDFIGMNDGKVLNIETKVIEVDSNGMRIEKSPDRIVVEEVGIDSNSGKEIKENRYIVM